ncbi:hypothetical protein LCGC14_2514290, partial [marine sediment metagenome]
MLSNVKSKIIILFSLGIIFALLPIMTTDGSFINTEENNSLVYNDDFIIVNKNLQISTLSGKIHINNNWSVTKSAGICTGSGTFSDPYVIEDLVIDAGRTGSGILIENSFVYFKIENCTIYNSGIDPFEREAGIKLINVYNGQLIENNLSNNYIGIILVGDNNDVLGNSVHNNQNNGISLGDSHYNNIIRNIIYNNTHGSGISINGNNNNISGNIVENSSFAGILIDGYVGQCEYNIVLDNVVKNNRMWGIHIWGGRYNTISGNTANNNNYSGIFIQDSDYNTFSRNKAQFNLRDGIGLDRSDYNSVLGNIVNNNSLDGIYSHYSESNNILGNEILYNNDNGINLDRDNNTIQMNNISFNGEDGIRLFDANDIVI